MACAKGLHDNDSERIRRIQGDNLKMASNLKMAGNRFLLGLLAPAALTLALTSALHAQAAPPPGTVLRQNATPAALPEAPGSVLTLPAPPEQGGRARTPVPVRHLRLEGDTLLPAGELEALTRPLEGRTVTLGELQQVAQRITALYQRHGYPLAYAFVPAQRITEGEVRISVIEPRYDRIEIQGKSRLRSTQARRTLGLTSGQVITQDALDRGLDRKSVV